MYIYPDIGENKWAQIQTALTQYPDITFFLIINPHSGPLDGTNDQDYPAFAAAISELQLAASVHNNAVLIGYVHTSWAARSAADVQSDIDKWVAIPELQPNGLFFDETTTSTGDSGYYSALADYARTKFSNPFIVLNPGTPPAADYFDYSGQIVIYEESAANSYKGVSGVDPSKFSAIINSVGSDANMQKTVTQLAGAGYGSIYVSDANDLYNGLGSNWGSFLQALDAAS